MTRAPCAVLAALALAGCTVATGVQLTVEGPGLQVDQLAIVATFGGRSVPRTVTIPTGVQLPAALFAEMPDAPTTVRFDVTGLDKGVAVGHALTQDLPIQPHIILVTSVTLEGSLPVDGGTPDAGRDGATDAAAPWTRQRGGVPPLAGAALTAVWGASPDDVYVTSGLSAGVNLLHSGDRGATFSGSAAGSDDLNGVWGASASEMFLVGAKAAVLHGSGTTWAQATTPAPGGTVLYSVWGTNAADVYAVGSGNVILHSVTGGWVSQNVAGATVLYGVWGSSSSDVYAVGSGGTILHSTGNAIWMPQTSGVTFDLRGVWGSGKSDVYVVGEGGTILRSTGNGTWSADPSGLPTTTGLSAVWGFGPSLIYAVGADWSILRSTGNGLWTPDPSGLTVDPVTSSRFLGFWGTGPTYLFTVGTGQTILHR